MLAGIVLHIAIMCLEVHCMYGNWYNCHIYLWLQLILYISYVDC